MEEWHIVVATCEIQWIFDNGKGIGMVDDGKNIVVFIDLHLLISFLQGKIMLYLLQTLLVFQLVINRLGESQSQEGEHLSNQSNSNQLQFYKQLRIVGMSESNLASKGQRFNLDNDDLKRKRRTRNDEDGRNFSCNCGKSYLSYPALYTHVKTKHNGKPEFTKLAQYGKDQNESVDMKDDEDIQSMEKIEESNNVQQLKRYLNKFFPLAQKQKDNDKKGRDLTKDDLGFLKGIKDYWQKHKKEDQPHENEAYATSIDNVFGKFLIDMESDISRSCQKFISEFVLNVRASLNELKGNQEFCKMSNAFQVPALMNDVFTDKFQKMEEGHLYLRHPTIICKTIYHFSRWLFQERFTNLSLKFNTV